MLTVTEGVNIVVTGVPVVVNGVATPSKVDLTADSAVIWTDPDVVGDTEFEIGPGTPLRVYLEGRDVAAAAELEHASNAAEAPVAALGQLVRGQGGAP